MEMEIRASKQEILNKYGKLELNFIRQRRGIFWYGNSLEIFHPVHEPTVEFTATASAMLKSWCTVRDFILRGDNISIIKKDTGAFLYVQTRS
jgi:hypothetical protein